MDILVALVLLAMLATIGALATGIGSMAGGGGFDDRHSHHLMLARVGLQALTIALLLTVLLLRTG
jgi:hypothetical protein